jgi:hypothetical protein
VDSDQPNVPPAEPLPAPQPSEARSPARRPGIAARAWGVVRRLLGTATVVMVVALVTVFSVDVGPWLREPAEKQAAKYLKREFHIGRLTARLLRGHFIVSDVVIGGLNPGDRPFFTAKQITVKVPWWSILTRRLVVESVDLRDWDMYVEQFADGRHSFPKFTPDDDGKPKGPKRFTTTVQVVRCVGGRFSYDDHGAPWSVDAPQLEVRIANTGEYRGEASFKDGLVRIASFEPMWANMRTRFKIDGGQIRLDRIDLETDGATSVINGNVDASHWPEQTYYVQSRVAFPRMREIFFAHDTFRLSGDGHFVGSFHLYKGGRELKGRFTSAEAGLNDWKFPALDGNLVWLRDRFDVTNASAGFYGGKMQFDYSMKPLGAPEPGRARFDVKYQDVDLTKLTDAVELPGLRLAGLARGRNLLEWPLGKFKERKGDGEIAAAPLDGLVLQTRERTHGSDAGGGDFDPVPFRAPVAVGGHLKYSYDPAWITIAPGWVATRRTYIEMEGRTAYGGQSQVPFHVTSGDWQESDRLLAGIISAVASPTHAVPIGGSGTFDGVMTGAFREPRVEGTFTGDRVRAWDVEWGHAEAKVVIANTYADVAEAVLTKGDSRMDIAGKYSLGYPRHDGGEEINGRIRVTRRSLIDLKHAFDLDTYRVDGLLTGEFHVYGRYTRPQGFGKMSIEKALAYGESFETSSASLRFEGTGLRMDGIRLAKGAGDITGAAYLDWEGHYSFNADGQRLPVEQIDALKYPSLPLYGFVTFSATGSGTFDAPRYDVKGRIDDLFAGDEGVGQVTGRLTVRGDTLTVNELEAASPRLAVSGTGRMNLTLGGDGEVTLRFTDTSIDPYVRLLQPSLSPFTTAVASGTIRASGALRDLDRLKLEGTVEDIKVSLFDYKLRNDGPLRLTMQDQVARVDRLKVVGDGTTMELFGEVGIKSERLRIRATGDANLSILQGFLRDIRSSGAAKLQAELTGPFKAPTLIGSATLSDGRLRYFGLPHSIESVNGKVEFDAGGVRLDGLTGKMGGGDVRFGGRIALKGATLDSYAITAVGRDMRLRYPEGFRSQIDADLALRGPAANPTLTGSVQVRDALWVRSIDTEGTGILGLAAVGGGKSGADAGTAASAATGFPLKFDVRLDAPSTLRIENIGARLVASAELTLRGTYDRPMIFGRAEVNRGEVLFEGNRYTVTRGTIDFSNPTKIDPFFDIEAETRARVPGEIYRVTFRVTGTRERFVWDLTSDPPLAPVDILALLFGDMRDPRDADVRGLRNRDRTEQELLATRAARLLASPLSSEVNKVVRKTFGVDSVVIAPSIGDLSGQQSARISPAARLTIGKRISDRLFLTYAQPITSSKPEQLVLIEYTQSDRLSWVVSRNEDETYAVDVRVRHVF